MFSIKLVYNNGKERVLEPVLDISEVDREGVPFYKFIRPHDTIYISRRFVKDYKKKHYKEQKSKHGCLISVLAKQFFGGHLMYARSYIEREYPECWTKREHTADRRVRLSASCCSRIIKDLKSGHKVVSNRNMNF